MQELAATMGLATGALYHYFGSKEQLLMAICDQLMDPLLDQATELLDEPAVPERQLRELVELWVAHVVEHRDHMLVFQQERHLIESGEHWRRVRSSRKAFERLVAGVLERARCGPTPGSLCSHSWGWSTTPRSGTGPAGIWHRNRSPRLTSRCCWPEGESAAAQSAMLTVLPGLKIPSGSSARLIACIISTAGRPCSETRKRAFP